MAGQALAARSHDGLRTRLDGSGHAVWLRAYLRRAVIADGACILAAEALAAVVRFAGRGGLSPGYLAFSGALPALWGGSVALAGGYEARFIGTGSDEFRRVLNAAVSLLAGISMVAYLADLSLARGYVMLTLPAATLLDLGVRHWLRKRLHRRWGRGECMSRVLAVGHASAVADLVATLRRDYYHGLAVVGACVAGRSGLDAITGIPVFGGLGSVAEAVRQLDADTVAVLACPEMDGIRLRELAWELEETGTGLCVAPALMDVAGPRTSIRYVAGLPLLHMDHPELDGGRQAIKSVFDKLVVAVALPLLVPLLGIVALAIRLNDGGPVLFWQTRVGKNGRTFRLCKFRTMVVDAEERKAQLSALNEGGGMLFKLHRDPRVTRLGALLRRWSVDEFPQLYNVLKGDMSLVGPRPAVPQEVARYGNHMRRRLAVKPGITGLWQVSGRSDLSWADALRLDLRYVENWSFALDLQIIWKTWSAVIRGSGAYLLQRASARPLEDKRLEGCPPLVDERVGPLAGR
jgi:exopolysaccharide biosynthesis polyprenyl glycosylphosphotransferase